MGMKFERLSKSIRAGFRSMSSPFGVLGTVLAAISTTNLVFTLFSIPVALHIQPVYASYIAYVHGLISHLVHWAGWTPPSWGKDLIVIYFLIGGFFMRSRGAEGIYDSKKSNSILAALRLVLQRRIVFPNGAIPAGSRMTVLYQESPGRAKRVLDTVLWPRVAMQYFDMPCVYFHEYSGTYQTFEADYTPGPRKEYLYDRRMVLAVQLLIVSCAVMVLCITNFLALNN